MRNRYRTRLRRIYVTSMMAVVSVLLTVSPAQAYSPNPNVYWAQQNAETCGKVNESRPPGTAAGYFYVGPDVSPIGEGCDIFSSSITYQFNIDVGGQNLLIELHGANGRVVAAVALEAAGDLLYVADLLDDSDTIYVWVGGKGPYDACPCGDGDVFSRHDLEFPEGQTTLIEITDDAAGNDVIASSGGIYSGRVFPFWFP